ncbi:Transposon Tf2-12 polyprotein [Trametes pubescens]|uniref:RNA-directed DNA polymerase n=1 Tax=Trametes pubescens TaxID=154538 RepID=A0A1M2W0E6_TRAPU|nr:Transposon Tf2-12 polyprotein [Trametes pubescens]
MYDARNDPVLGRYTTAVNASGEATVIHLNLKTVPSLTAGRVTPAALFSWEAGCRQYFRHKSVEEKNQVAFVSGGLQDPRMMDWWMTNAPELEVLSFKEFMAKLRAQWLPANWANEIVTSMFQNKQKDEDSFDVWVTSLEKQNVYLRDTPHRFTDTALRGLISATACEEMRMLMLRSEYFALTEYASWKAALSAFDNEHLTNRARRFREFEQFTRSKSAPSGKLRSATLSSTTGSSGNSGSSGSGNKATHRWPALTDAEKKILGDNDGCYKCRRIDVNHQSRECPNGFPTLAGYKTPAEQLKAKSLSKGEQRKVAAVIVEEGPNEKITVAAVNAGSPDSPLAACSGILSDGDSSDDDVRNSSFTSPHVTWRVQIKSPSDCSEVVALIDTGSPLVLIREDTVARLQLRRRKLHTPTTLGNAFNGESSVAKEWCKLTVTTSDGSWTSVSVQALIVPVLCSPLILGTPFLSRNQILVDVSNSALWHPASGRDLTIPLPRSLDAKKPTAREHREDALAQRELREEYRYLQARFSLTQHRDVVRQLKTQFGEEQTPTSMPPVNCVAAVRERVEELAFLDSLKREDAAMKSNFADCFPSDIPHLDNLPKDEYHHIRLKDPNMTIVRRQYDCPKKYREAWKTLLDQHVLAGRLRPFSSPYASPCFLIPKSDPDALPRWVNDYRALNANTIPDVYPLPSIQDILSDCGKGKIWAKLDMTNSFFQTHVAESDIKYTAVTTPFGLFEWTVMPQGARNAPSTHQRRMYNALRPLIGKICHVYLDDIIIWSNSLAEHRRNVRRVLQTLRDHKLYCSLKKTDLFCVDLRFLGHRISRAGIQPDGEKIAKITDWPTPFLPHLAELTATLNPLTTKEAEKDFAWTTSHEEAFVAIKQLVLGHECLTVIDHANMGDNKVFVATDASDFCTGAVLMYGPSIETTRPVAFESCQLKAAELNYPVHEKELLAIVRAMKKWRVDLLGVPFTVLTDHRTLENFTTQKHLSRRQARWQEFLGQYDYQIAYIKGDLNTAADALSRLSCPTVDTESLGSNVVAELHLVKGVLNGLTGTKHAHVTVRPPSVAASTLRVSSDPAWLMRIQRGYAEDKWCMRLLHMLTGGQGDVIALLNSDELNGRSSCGVSVRNRLLFVGDRLCIPRVSDLREGIFRLAHDSLGHFGFDKSYEAIRADYFWPKMRTELESLYIPSCDACQCNKGNTRKPAGPLHPLPVPDGRCDSVAIDFIGALPDDGGFNCIATMTDCLGSELRFVPCRTDISAEDFAGIFFQHWYCENGLPLNIVSDRDKLFVSRFWKALHKLMGVKLNMSTAFHPETDGSSERSNKTVVQMLRYHVARNQSSWVRALPLIRFQLMSTVNASTGYTPFHLRHGRSPRVVPPIFEEDVATATSTTDVVGVEAALAVLCRLETNVMEAQDSLLMAKSSQAFFANSARGPDLRFSVGDRVLLSTFHRQREYMQRGSHRVAKFMVRFDGPFTITRANPDTSTYSLDLPASMNIFPTFHSSLLRPYLGNDDVAFPRRANPEPGPIVTAHGEEEFFVEKILDRHRVGRGWQYLVRWLGYGPGSDSWLPGREVDELAALDDYLRENNLAA